MSAVSRSSGVVFEKIEGRAVMVSPVRNELITLSVEGTMVWEALESPLTIDDLTEALLQRFSGVEREQLKADLQEFIDELAEAGLVTR